MSALTLADLEQQDRDRETCGTVATPSNETVQQVFKRPVVVSAGELLTTTFPPREKLLAPWLTSQSLSMLYAPRGVGKTHVAMGIAYALASGGEFLGWRAHKPVDVLYLDGEMPGADLSERLASIVRAAGDAGPPDRLRFMTPDMQPDGVMPNLYSPAGQQHVRDAAEASTVIIVDNLSALVRGGKENEGESWQPVAEWALSLRASGRSVLFIHHAGKTGQQRGTSKREDLLDTVIALRRPGDYSPDQGARFEVHFEKARALYGQDVTPMEAALTTGTDGRQSWAVRSAADSIDAQLLEMMELGLAQGEAARELGVNRSTVIRRLKKLQEEGRFTPRPKNKGGRPRDGDNVVPLRRRQETPCPRCAGEGCEWC